MFHAVDRNLIAKTVYYGYARLGTSPMFSPNKEFFTPDTYKTSFDPKKAASLLDAAGYPKRANAALQVNLLAAGWFAENGKIGAIVKQGLEDVGIAVNLTVPDRPTSIKRIYTDYDFDLAISNQANPSEPVPSTTQYYTSDGIKKGVPFRNASGFSTPARWTRWSRRSRSRPIPPSARRWWSSSRRWRRSKRPTCRWSSSNSITVASTRVQNHSNDPNYLARPGTTYGWRPSQVKSGRKGVMRAVLEPTTFAHMRPPPALRATFPRRRGKA